MHEINGMDMLGYLRIRAWRASREKIKREPVRRFIDEAWPSLRP